MLIAALASEASLHADALLVRREVTMRSARPFVFALAVGLVAMLILFLAWPGQTGQLLARALAPDPANRYASAADMVRALDDSVASVPPTPPAPRPG